MLGFRNIPSIILCAGGSHRMGSPKGLLSLDGRPLLSRHVACLVRFGRVTVVLGASENEYRAILPESVRVVVNRDWATTHMVDSLRLASAGLSTDSCLVTPVDVPPAAAATLGALLCRGAPAVPVDRLGRRGHPVLLDRASLSALRKHAPPEGLRDLLASAPEVTVSDDAVALQFNTPAEWAAFAQR
jgi:CTP:molybdopterin cytidylyltransferase MocA